MKAATTASFEELVEDVTGGNSKIQRGDYLPVGEFPIVDQGQDLVGGYWNDADDLVSSHGPWIVFGDHTRTLKYLDAPFCLGADGVKVLKPRSDKRLDAKYLYHFLVAHPVPSAGYSRHFKFLKKLEIPLPPIDEQRRIAAILDKADALRRKRKRALDLLDGLRQSIFSDMFGDLLSSSQFERGFIGDWVADFETGKNLAPDPDSTAPDAFRVLKVSAVTSGTFNPAESKPLPNTYSPPKSHFVRKGDLLFSRANTSELIGATAYVGHDVHRLVLPDKIWRFRWHAKHTPHPLFVHALFSTPMFRQELSKRATGTSGSMKNISKEKVLSIPIGKPTRAQQEAFVERLSVLAAMRDRSAQQGILFDRQFASLQHRAFTGQL